MGNPSTGRCGSHKFFTSPDGRPPVLVDPRRWGALIGVTGGLVFVLGHGPALGAASRSATGAVAVGLALLALVGLGVLGLVVGYDGIAHAADAAAVLSGLVMLGLVLADARGRFVVAEGQER